MDDGSFNHWPTSEEVSLLFNSYAQNFEDVILARVFPGHLDSTSTPARTTRYSTR